MFKVEAATGFGWWKVGKGIAGMYKVDTFSWAVGLRTVGSDFGEGVLLSVKCRGIGRSTNRKGRRSILKWSASSQLAGNFPMRIYSIENQTWVEKTSGIRTSMIS